MSDKNNIIEIDVSLKELIPFFVEETMKDFKKLEMLLGEEDCMGVKQLAHTLKGECGSYGFSELGDLARHLERVIEYNEINDARKIVEEMKILLSSSEIHFKVVS